MPPPQAGGRMSLEERQRLREDLQSARRDVYRDEERRLEFERLRERVRSGQMTREEAIRQYRERFGDARPPQPPPQDARPPARPAPEHAGRRSEIERLREAVREGRMSPQEARERLREERMRRAAEAGRLSPEEREQLRRDIHEANRNLERR
jgi:hypothetical protein